MKKIAQMYDKNEKKRNKFIEFVKKNKKKIVMLVLLCALIYIAYMVINLIKDPTDTVYVEHGSIQEEESAEGYIVRDETVIKGNNYKNGIEQIKTEGEKVAKGEKIFRYYSNDEKDLVEKIKKLDSKIDEAMSEEKLSLIPDTKILEEQIDSKINQLYGESNLEVIKNSKQEINTNMTKKAKIAGDQSPGGSYLKKLVDERKKYENQLNSGTEYLPWLYPAVFVYPAVERRHPMSVLRPNWLLDRWTWGSRKLLRAVVFLQSCRCRISHFHSDLLLNEYSMSPDLHI